MSIVVKRHLLLGAIVGFVTQRYPTSAHGAAGRSAAGLALLLFLSPTNIPPGWRAWQTYVIHGPDEFEEIFELAEAGKPFELYSRAWLKRIR